MEKEILLDKHKFISSRTNKQGIITSVNEYFVEISGYSIEELINSNHNIIRHPDMPKAIFKLLWQTLLKEKKSLKAVVKNKAKSGDYYWVITEFTFSEIDKELSIKGKRTPVNRNLIKRIEPIYKEMKKIEEETNSIENSLNYFYGLIKEKGYTEYDDFIEYLSKPTLFEKIKNLI